MTTVPLRFGPAVPITDFESIRSRMALECFKWDSQVGDVSTLFSQPLLITPQTWGKLQQLAEKLASELNEAEQEVLQSRPLISMLGLPRPFELELGQHGEILVNAPAVRVLRFDFHYTSEGWRISEVNSDVPGGYTEASCYTDMMAHHISESHSSGNPADAWARAVVEALAGPKNMALLSAPGFLEDQQVTAFLADKLRRLGINTFLLHDPAQLEWQNGAVFARRNGSDFYFDGILRFYQGEWLARLPERSGWKALLFNNTTLVVNPAIAVLTESKRFFSHGVGCVATCSSGDR